MRSTMVVAVGVALLVVGACRREPVAAGADAGRVADGSSGTAAASASAAAADDEARAAVVALRVSHGLACSIAVVDAAAHCHDEVSGFAAARKCYADGLAQAKGVQAKKPPPSAKLACAKTIETAELGYIDGTVALLTDMLAWLDAHRAGLTVEMAGHPLSEACDGRVKCDDEPSEFDEKHAAASWASISAIECAKTVFQCGVISEKACWLPDVTDRLGLACDPSENKPNDLRVRATGTQLP